MLKNTITNSEKCIGCGVCATICPQRAISFEQDRDGFFSPFINNDLCINCGACLKKCLAESPIKSKNTKQNMDCFYGFWKSSEIDSCQSGGFCTVISRYVIEHGGVVFGVTYSSDFSNAEYKMVDNLDDLNCLKGSKYIQSKPIDFDKLKKELISNRLVLVIGLPCHISALVNWANNKYKNLLTISLICHGPVSNLVHNKFLNEYKNGKVLNFTVKGKVKGKNCGYTTIISEKNRYSHAFNDTEYGRLFDLVLRKSCYSCNYKIYNNLSDVIAGDYWCNDISRVHNEKGNSSVIILRNNFIWNNILQELHDFHFEHVELQELINQNPAIINKATENNERDTIIKLLNSDTKLKNICPDPCYIKIIKKIRVLLTTILSKQTQILLKGFIKRLKSLIYK